MLYQAEGGFTWFSLNYFRNVHSKARLEYTCVTCTVNGTEVPSGAYIYFDRISSVQVRYAVGYDGLSLHSDHPTGLANVSTTPRGVVGFKVPTSASFAWVSVRVLSVAEGARPFYRECDELGFQCLVGLVDTISSLEHSNFISNIPHLQREVFTPSYGMLLYYTVGMVDDLDLYNTYNTSSLYVDPFDTFFLIPRFQDESRYGIPMSTYYSNGEFYLIHAPPFTPNSAVAAETQTNGKRYGHIFQMYVNSTEDDHVLSAIGIEGEEDFLTIENGYINIYSYDDSSARDTVPDADFFGGVDGNLTWNCEVGQLGGAAHAGLGTIVSLSFTLSAYAKSNQQLAQQSSIVWQFPLGTAIRYYPDNVTSGETSFGCGYMTDFIHENFTDHTNFDTAVDHIRYVLHENTQTYEAFHENYSLVVTNQRWSLSQALVLMQGATSRNMSVPDLNYEPRWGAKSFTTRRNRVYTNPVRLFTYYYIQTVWNIDSSLQLVVRDHAKRVLLDETINPLRVALIQPVKPIIKLSGVYMKYCCIYSYVLNKAAQDAHSANDSVWAARAFEDYYGNISPDRVFRAVSQARANETTVSLKADVDYQFRPTTVTGRGLCTGSYFSFGRDTSNITVENDQCVDTLKDIAIVNVNQIYKLRAACNTHGYVWREASNGPGGGDRRWNSRHNNVTYNAMGTVSAISYPFVDGTWCNTVLVPKFFKMMTPFSDYGSRHQWVSRRARGGDGNSYAHLTSCLQRYETCAPFYYWSGTNAVVLMSVLRAQARLGFRNYMDGNGVLFAGVDNDPWTVTRVDPHFTGSLTPHFQELRRHIGRIPAVVFGEPVSRQNLAYLKDGHKAYYIFEVVEASPHEETRNATQLLYPCNTAENRIPCGMKIMGPDGECERVQVVGGGRRLKCTTRVVNGLLLPIRIVFKQIARIDARFQFCWSVTSYQSIRSGSYQDCYYRSSDGFTCDAEENCVNDWSRVAGDRFYRNTYHSNCDPTTRLRASSTPNCNRFDVANFTIPSFDLRGKLYFNSPEIVTV